MSRIEKRKTEPLTTHDPVTWNLHCNFDHCASKRQNTCRTVAKVAPTMSVVSVFRGKREFQSPVARCFPRLSRTTFGYSIVYFLFTAVARCQPSAFSTINFLDKLQFSRIEFNGNAHANRIPDAWINFIIDCRTLAHPPTVKQLRELARILFCSEENVNNGVDGKININGIQTHAHTHLHCACTFVVAHTIPIMTFSSFFIYSISSAAVFFSLVLFRVFRFNCLSRVSTVIYADQFAVDTR